MARAGKGRYGRGRFGRALVAPGIMIGFSKFTPRMWLILAHDLLATAAAVLASFFIRFEDAGLAERWRLLLIMLPPFVVYAGFVYGFSVSTRPSGGSPRCPTCSNIVRGRDACWP